jgi:5'-deoxynucleotidase YfbR-like HD superfamily hydrolase
VREAAAGDDQTGEGIGNSHMKETVTPLSKAAPVAPPKRAWQRMLSGRRLDLLNPSPADIEIEDIAHGLARVARWNGQTLGPCAFSVAQHCLIVDEIAGARVPDWPARWRLAALLHDAPEYVVGDLISPFKTAIGLDYKAFEMRLLAAIHARFGIPAPLPEEVQAEIKTCDRIAAFYEATRLAGFGLEEATLFFGSPRGLPEEIERLLANLQPMPADAAQREFLARFQWLIERLQPSVAGKKE